MSQEKHLSKREKNKIEKRKALIDASLDLFLEFGVEVVTIDVIVKKAAISKGSFYNYFDSKPSLISAIFEPYYDTVKTSFAKTKEEFKHVKNDEDLFELYKGLAMALALTFLANPKVTLLFIQNNKGPATPSKKVFMDLYELVISECYEITVIARKYELFGNDIDPAVSTLTVVGAVETLLSRFFGNHFQPEKGLEIIDDLIELILNGLKPTFIKANDS